MKRKTFTAITIGLISVFALASCDLENPFGVYGSSADISTSTIAGDGKVDFRTQKYYTGMHSGPSTGDVKMLVIPFNFAENSSVYTNSNAAGQKLKEDLNKCFFGSAEDTNYWESVSSYYKKSSYGKINITGTVTDIVSVNYTSTASTNSLKEGDSVTDFTTGFTISAVNALIDNGLDYSEYDSDNDGYIDYIWMVYTTPYDKTGKSELLWAYTSWIYSQDYATISNASKYQHATNYSWASSDFMVRGTSTGLDAHTFIHETGHQMGLDDYYSYDDVTKTSSPRSPLGVVDMMDSNIGDHGALSKYCLDWTTPVIGEADHTYTLKPFESSGDLVLISDANYNGSPYDEYFLVEYYTPTGLNKLDATTKYESVLGLTASGLKITHIDQRLGKVNVSRTSGTRSWDQNYYDNPDVTKTSSGSYYDIVSSNSKKYCWNSDSYCLDGLVQASGNTNLMSTSLTSLKFAQNSDLFTPSSKVFGKDINPSINSSDYTEEPFILNITSMNSEGITFTLTAK